MVASHEPPADAPSCRAKASLNASSDCDKTRVSPQSGTKMDTNHNVLITTSRSCGPSTTACNAAASNEVRNNESLVEGAVPKETLNSRVDFEGAVTPNAPAETTLTGNAWRSWATQGWQGFQHHVEAEVDHRTQFVQADQRARLKHHGYVDIDVYEMSAADASRLLRSRKRRTIRLKRIHTMTCSLIDPFGFSLGGESLTPVT